ncbi:dehydrogenase [Lithospermum erythrorhizon]|uniref:FAD-dependent oxidoreductase domain-containing protein 1 n=1 Tax=Lithospermum erythrorhizon TaxID=34254 RepID=A0AAV3PY99_LITER
MAILNSSIIPNQLTTKLFPPSKQVHHTSKKPRPGIVHVSGYKFDVVVIGAGIIGLTIARQFLTESNLSVAIVDSHVPCSGATGAGQGYLWKVHKDPEGEKWELSMRSHNLWEKFAESLESQNIDPLRVLGWKKTGSLLVGRTTEESAMLKRKVDKLCEVGVETVLLSHDELLLEEPSLALGVDGMAAFLPDDYQIDARCAVGYIEEANRKFSAEGRYTTFYHEPVTSLLRTASGGEIEAVQTSNNIIYGRKAVVLAAGCWSGSFMQDLIKDSDTKLHLPVKPRKGHLLVFENFSSVKLNHGIMEVGYVNHQSAALGSRDPGQDALDDAEELSVSMTATMDKSGNLVLGSSRQFVGFNTQKDESIIRSIWERAVEFFPFLRKQKLEDLIKRGEVRVGLRPFLVGGRPVIGNLPELSNFYIAAGHEGEGLSLALGTAEMIVDMVLGNSVKVNPAPYSVQSHPLELQ